MAYSHHTQIQLPPASQKGILSLEEALAQRRSVRHFTPEPLTQAQLSQILWASQGISDTHGRYRTVPSA
ncbi:nitroreductase family protein, partial [Candidatus Omnitrophota bacterium]